MNKLDAITKHVTQSFTDGISIGERRALQLLMEILYICENESGSVRPRIAARILKYLDDNKISLT